ncbi:PHD and RING finger domain-containing protein 1 isoform X2 [Brachyhypopomus gauderio]|uniref:PHD and RING finger domain-containing protein 1 isoform X2 n=1 Tax=Brachyhypopomus gauderio TaxID=698409 RepID=UPI0040414163
MDEDDSQDELINKNASHGKSKRPAASILSDEEDNSEESENSQEGATDSEEDDHDSLGGEDGEEEDEDDASEHEDAQKDLQVAVGSAPAADLEWLSSDEDTEKCPICLNSFHEQPVATPESCEHYFCLDCILEWAKNANSCPVDRLVFTNILLRTCYGGKVQKTITVQKPAKLGQEEQLEVDLELTSCEVCGGSDREDRLLLCDGCDAGYHMECLTPPLNAVPVEEWFCPECAADGRNTRGERVSEDERIVLPTTSRPRPDGPRPTRAIARTQHSERVRANVNRHRITQARTAAQLAPHYLVQSTWLDETINAVVAGLNTAVYVRDLTPRPRSHRRRRTVRRRKTKKEGKSAGVKAPSAGTKRRKRKHRRTKSRKKMVVKKITGRSRIARSLGIRRPARSSSVPSVYRPSEQTLGSMRADIGAASLSIYGDPFDLDPFDDREEGVEQAQSLPSLLEAKRRGLSRSALRSHQPVARPIPAGLSGGRGHSIPQVEEVAGAAPVPDLLGSILSGQSLLLMDSSDVVINRDGSLKATKPVCLSSPRSSVPSVGEMGHSPSTETSVFQFSREPAPSSGPSSSHTSPLRCPASLMPTSPCPPPSHTPLPVHPGLQMPLPHRPMHPNPAATGHCQRGTSGVRGQPPARVTSSASDPHRGEGGGATQQAPAKKPPPKPVWVDVSVLPRIPKIKRENGCSSNRSHISSLPESSLSSLAGDNGRQHSVDQQGASTSQQGRTVDGQRQRPDRAGPSASFSNSFSTPSTSSSASSNLWPSSSSSISFRISTSGNSWHARRLSAPEPAMPAKDENSLKKNQKDKRILLSSHSQAKKTSLKSEVYDPFNPTGSDSSDSESDSDCHEANAQSAILMVPNVGQNENAELLIKTEPMDLDSPVEEECSGICVKVKEEPLFSNDDPCPLPSHQSSTGQMQSCSFAALTAYSRSPATSDAERSETPEKLSPQTGSHSRSSSTSSHRSDKKIKVELKTEPEDGPSPIKSKSLAESQVPKDNGLCDGTSSGASTSRVCTKSKEEETRSPQSKSEEGGQSPLLSRDFETSHKMKKHLQSDDRRHTSSKSPGHRRSRSRSREKRRSHSRSKEQSNYRSQDRRRLSRSSSRERSKKRKAKHESRERCDSRGKDCRKSRERRRSRSRSRSRSRERRRELPSSCRSPPEPRDADGLQIKHSRSTSRDRRQKRDMLEGSCHKERSTQKSVESTSMVSEESPHSSNDILLSLEKEPETVGNDCETLSVVSIEKEKKASSPWYSALTEECKNNEDVKEAIPLICVLKKTHEIKQENVFPINAVKESRIPKDIKTEKKECSKLCDKLKNPEEIKMENPASPIMNKSQKFTEVNFFKTTHGDQAGYSAQQDEKKGTNDNLGPQKQFKVEQFWLDEDDEDPCCSDVPLVISLNSPDPASMDCKKEADGEPISLPEVAKNEIEMASLQQPCSVKQEPVDSSDDDISVDYLIDNLDFIKKEMKEDSVINTSGTEEPHPTTQEVMAGVKQEMESALVMAGTKTKSQGKRVTWNIQEPEGPQPEKMSKLALFKLKLKQEGSRKGVSSSATQSSVQAVPAAVGPKPPAADLNPPDQGASGSHREEPLQDSHHKDKYMKKLHMQERAVEEVKLAIKPFYQKRDITKEEYKDILRKAVQKVCHSKSGEINPVKVAKLVKAYVEKYKHARRHHKGEDSGHRQTAALPNTSETSG